MAELSASSEEAGASSSPLLDERNDIQRRERTQFDFGRRATWPNNEGVGLFEDGGDEVLDTFEDRAGHLLRAIGRSSEGFLGRRYFTDLVATESDEQARLLLDDLFGKARSYKNELLLISLHGDHIHVIHDCPYTNGSCRCKIFEGTKAEKHLRRRPAIRPYIRGMSRRDWYYIVLYFSTAGRKLVFAKVGGIVRVLPLGLENLSARRPTGETSIGTLETCYAEDNLDVSSEGSSRGHGRKNKRARRLLGNSERRQDYLQAEMEQIMRKRPCCPMMNIVRTKLWLEHPVLMCMRDDDKVVKSVIDAWQSLVCSWTIHDFILFYSQEECKPLFHSGHMSLWDYYYSREESKDILMGVLRFQFDDDIALINQFVVDLYNVVERKIPKLNTFLIHSPPSGGKNFFIDAVMDFYWNRGQLGNPNRFNQFAHMEATNKRILLWNEPNYESCATDTLKMLFAGDSLTVRVKNKGDSAVYRTPVIVLTNNLVNFMSDNAFTDRIKQYRWKAAPYLKEYGKKPYPLAWYDLLLELNIIQDIE